MKNKFTKWGGAIASAMLLTSLSAFGQSVPYYGSYAKRTLTIPVNTLTAAAGTTNLANGWSSVVSVTNTATTWNSSSSAFVSTTNVISVTNTVYADMNISFQKDLFLVVNESTGIGTNVYTFARGVDSSSVDTNNTGTITVGHTAAGALTGSTNFPAAWNAGAGIIRLTSLTWTAAAAGWTNNGITFGQIQGSK